MKAKLIVLLGVLGVSFSAIFVKYTTAPAVVIAFYRMFFAAVILLPVVWKTCRDEWKALEKRTALMCVLSGVFLACHFSFYFQSIAYTSIASSTVLVDTEVFFVAIVSILFLKEKVSRLGAFSIFLTFAGSVVLALSDRSAGSNAVRGDLLAVTGAFFVALYTLIGRVERRKMSTTLYTFLVYGTAALTLALFCAATRLPIVGYAPKNYALGLGLALCCTLLGHSVFSWGLKYLPATFISTAKLGEPVFATVLGIFLFGQIPKLQQVIGAVIILAGLYLYTAIPTGGAGEPGRGDGGE